MKLIVNEDRTVLPVGNWGTENENNYEILDIELPEKFNDYNKRIVYYLDDERKWDIIVDNKVFITNAVTKFESVKAYVWLTKGETTTLKYVCNGTEEGSYYFNYNDITYYFIMPEIVENDELIFNTENLKLTLNDTEISISTVGIGTELEFKTEIEANEDFRTKLFEMRFYENENADGLIPTEEEIDGFNDMLTAMNNKIAEANTAIEMANNLDIDLSEKVDGKVTLTITKKDGTTEETKIVDGIDGVNGVGLNYNWNGTELGIKREDESEYNYVNLKGDKGDTGATGQAGRDGVDGKDGQNGQDGYTPVKGVDYFTSAEINEFTTTITNSVNQNIGLRLDAINGEIV